MRHIDLLFATYRTFDSSLKVSLRRGEHHPTWNGDFDLNQQKTKRLGHTGIRSKLSEKKDETYSSITNTVYRV